MVEIPLICSLCGHENMVDLMHMESRSLSKLVTVEGFTCEACKGWEAVFRTTASLNDAMKKLSNRPTPYKFEKVLKKAEAIQERQ